jgi:SEC-C motif
MNPNHTHVHELHSGAVSFTEEARRIQGRALGGEASIVRLGQIVFFSTESGDAWMLDPADGYAVCLARDFAPRLIPIQETPARLEIGWDANYKIEGDAFTVTEGHAAARTILGYPIAEIQRLIRESPATPLEGSSNADHARERLRFGRNDPCPCGSGKKYKKCCLARDEALVRQSAAAQGSWADARAERTSPITGGTSGAVPNGSQFSDSADSAGIDTELPPEAEGRANALWDEFEAWKQPTPEQMDTFLANLLVLPPQATSWDELFHRFARHNHPGLPGVFRRIAVAAPHTKDAGMAFFYWAAAEEFARRQLHHLLPEVAMRFRGLDLENYDADALYHLEDYLLAEGFEAETLELAEHFLPIVRADSGLMPHVVPELCELIFELRAGQHLRSDQSSANDAGLLEGELRRGIEEEVHQDAARGAAEIIAGRSPAPGWARSLFDLVSGDIHQDDAAWRQNLRLYEVLMYICRETWQLEQQPPGCALRGLTLVLKSVYDWPGADRKKRRRASGNLLDLLRPPGLERRLVRACPELVGVNEPRARLLLDAHGILLRFAERHQLVSEADATESRKELARLQHVLNRTY